MSLLQRMKRPLTILVEGNIGAGKSQFLDRFKVYPNIQILQEPVEKWRNVNGNNLLQNMYQDPSRWALAFQTYVQLTMLEQHMKAEEPVKLMERSIFSARYCFVENLKQEGKLQSSEYEVLDAWFRYLNESPDIHLEVDLLVYLKTSPQVAYERLKKRNRGEEHLISLDYVKDLHSLHEEWLLNHRFPVPAPVHIIDADKEHSELDSDFNALQNIINKHLTNSLATKKSAKL